MIEENQRACHLPWQDDCQLSHKFIFSAVILSIMHPLSRSELFSLLCLRSVASAPAFYYCLLFLPSLFCSCHPSHCLLVASHNWVPPAAIPGYQRLTLNSSVQLLNFILHSFSLNLSLQHGRQKVVTIAPQHKHPTQEAIYDPFLFKLA